MSELIPFEFEAHTIDIHVDDNGNPWWEAGQVVTALGLKGDAGQHVRRLDEDDKTLISNQGGGSCWIINESGLYSMILGSRKKAAKAFKRWITREVIPSIRKTGHYSMSQTLPVVRDPALQAIISTTEQVKSLVIELDATRHLAQTAKAESAQAQDLALRAYQEVQMQTIAEFVFFNKLQRQLPESEYPRFGRCLSAYCLEHGIPVRDVPVAGKRWCTEKAYPSPVIHQLLWPWLQTVREDRFEWDMGDLMQPLDAANRG